MAYPEGISDLKTQRLGRSRPKGRGAKRKAVKTVHLSAIALRSLSERIGQAVLTLERLGLLPPEDVGRQRDLSREERVTEELDIRSIETSLQFGREILDLARIILDLRSQREKTDHPVI